MTEQLPVEVDVKTVTSTQYTGQAPLFAFDVLI
jgi:hypothetical protein